MSLKMELEIVATQPGPLTLDLEVSTDHQILHMPINAVVDSRTADEVAQPPALPRIVRLVSTKPPDARIIKTKRAAVAHQYYEG